MMDVLFVTPTTDLSLKSRVNGTMILGTLLLQAGISVEILRFGQLDSCGKDYAQFIEEITGQILERKPRAVSFYSLWPDHHVMLRIAAELKAKRPELVTVMGGIQASLTAGQIMEAMPFVDYICTGEGESTVVPFFQQVLAGAVPDRVPGVYYRVQGEVRRNGEEPALCVLDEIPHWDDRLYLEEARQEKGLDAPDYYMPIDAGRGCPFGCTFCCSSLYWHRNYRLKSAQRILEDMEFYYHKLGIRSFNLTHDAFTTNKKLVYKICDSIVEKGWDIQWRCTSRIDCVDPEYLLKMKAAGMRHIEFGVETGSDRMQNLINKKLNLERVRQTVRFCVDNGISVALFFMYGFPEETEEDLNQTMELYFQLRDMNITYISLSFCNFNPGTVLTRKYMDQLVLDPRIQVSHRGIFGYRQEEKRIRENRSIFPFYYHLSTPVRDQYQYMTLLGYLYGRLPASRTVIHSLYGGDNLALYRDFVEGNREVLQDIDGAVSYIRENPLQAARNLLRQRQERFIPQLISRLEYEADVVRVFGSREDMSLEREYAFSIIDYQKKLPMEQYSPARTQVLLEKKNGKGQLRVLGVQYLDEK